MLLIAALVGAAAMSANAGVRFGFSMGLPLPVVVATPVGPVPTAVVVTVPASPRLDYVWVPGYWSYRTTGYAWVRGSWCYRPAYVRGHFYGGHRW